MPIRLPAPRPSVNKIGTCETPPKEGRTQAARHGRPASVGNLSRAKFRGGPQGGALRRCNSLRGQPTGGALRRCNSLRGQPTGGALRRCNSLRGQPTGPGAAHFDTFHHPTNTSSNPFTCGGFFPFSVFTTTCPSAFNF